MNRIQDMICSIYLAALALASGGIAIYDTCYCSQNPKTEKTGIIVEKRYNSYGGPGQSVYFTRYTLDDETLFFDGAYEDRYKVGDTVKGHLNRCGYFEVSQ
ncbi:MAG: hypothetical protein HYW24_02860 [Candidatus Aenigmarchaeota archaeon]|nr:hypothetical protein [Candidatus Aenigmarchaeota archaeon]